MSTLRLAVLVLVLLLAAANVLAYDGPMRFSVFWPCNGNSESCAPRILAEGIVEGTTDKKFEEFLSNKKAHRYELPATPIVSFDSSGGSMSGGIALGRVIRRNKFGTQVSLNYSRVVEKPEMHEVPLVKNAKCASACTLAFVGGVLRILDPDARFGIHQFSGTSGNVGDGPTQVAVVLLATYLEDMGIDRGLVDVASLVPASNIQWLSLRDARKLRVDNTTSQASPWSIKASPKGVPLLLTVQELSRGRTISLLFFVENGRAVVQASTRLERSAFAADRIGQFPVNEPPELSFSADGKNIKAEPIGLWARSDFKDGVGFRALAAVSLSDLQTIARAKSLEISDNFGRAASDLSLSMSLSTEDLAPGVALLLRTQ